MSDGDVSQPIAATTLVSGESIPDSERRDKGVYDVSRGHVSPAKRVYVRILPEDCVSHLDLQTCWMQRTKDAATWLDDVVSHTMELLVH